MVNVALVRPWVLMICGVTAIVVGMVEANAALVVLGFGVVGGEPVARAVNGKRNGA